jgi:hypothetical protein
MVEPRRGLRFEANGMSVRSLRTRTRAARAATADRVADRPHLEGPQVLFEPAGLSFWTSVEVRLPFSGDADRAAMFWSRPGGDGFERLVGWVEGGTVGACIDHFSEGFVDDGDGECFGEDPTP